MAGKRDGKGKAARRKAQMDRLAAASGAGESQRARAREDAARAAAAEPSAGRWLVATEAGDVRAVDVVADLLVLDPRTSLRGRGGDALRDLASSIADLVSLDVVAPSGRPLAEIVAADAELRDQLRPTFDLDALLGGGPVAGDRHDRTVRLAGSLLERAAAHREGSVDLHVEVAPVGVDRHPQADELELTAQIATDGLALPAGPEPAVVTTTGGWFAVAPVELFYAGGRGLLTGVAAEVGGAALAAWLQEVIRDPVEPRWAALHTRIAADPAALLDAAAARAGSDHPDVVGPALVELIALRHPIAPPG